MVTKPNYLITIKANLQNFPTIAMVIGASMIIMAPKVNDSDLRIYGSAFVIIGFITQKLWLDVQRSHFS